MQAQGFWTGCQSTSVQVASSAQEGAADVGFDMPHSQYWVCGAALVRLWERPVLALLYWWSLAFLDSQLLAQPNSSRIAKTTPSGMFGIHSSYRPRTYGAAHSGRQGHACCA